ncbi:MAG: hypothetical protein SGJ10_15025 [Bacteroidota bacterium]|nr:hypothetical protein [Bacteroidota bacterium]
MKHIYIILSSILFSFNLFAQQKDTITVNSSTKKITIGKHIILSTTTIEQVKKMLGKPDRIEKLVGKERVFVYDKLGFSFEIGRDTTVRTLTSFAITYNFDGDRKVSKNIYIGTLILDKYHITKKTTAQDINTNTSLKLDCVANIMCVTDPNGKGMGVMLTFVKDTKEVSVIGFRLN